jgi:uncharacterized membrane protein YqhA
LFRLPVSFYIYFLSTIGGAMPLISVSLYLLLCLQERPKWLEIHSVSDLKTKLGHVIVMVLLVGISEKSKRVTITSCTDLFCFAASILLSSGCLYLLSKLGSTKGGSHA